MLARPLSLISISSLIKYIYNIPASYRIRLNTGFRDTFDEMDAQQDLYLEHDYDTQIWYEGDALIPNQSESNSQLR